jgi:cellulose synthase (UDP-forming)
LIAGAALGVVAERRELRGTPRLAIARCGKISFDGHVADAAIENVSAGGCAIRVGASAFIEDSLHFGKPGGRLAVLRADGQGYMQTIAVVPTRVERDGETVIIGLRFDEPATADYLVLADLMYGEAEALAKFLAARRKHMGLLRGIMVFLGWSLCEPFRAFRYLFARRLRAPAGIVEIADAGATTATPAAMCAGPVSGSAEAVARVSAPLIADAPPISPDAPMAAAAAPVEGHRRPSEPDDPELWIREYLAFAEDLKSRGYMSASGGQQKTYARVA